jgi:hypothetical protein
LKHSWQTTPAKLKREKGTASAHLGVRRWRTLKQYHIRLSLDAFALGSSWFSKMNQFFFLTNDLIATEAGNELWVSIFSHGISCQQFRQNQ